MAVFFVLERMSRREVSHMSRTRSWLAILLAGAAIAAVWIVSRKTMPLEVDFVKITRETIVSTLATNGRVEPLEWMPARAERSGVVTRVLVSRGQRIKKD